MTAWTRRTLRGASRRRSRRCSTSGCASGHSAPSPTTGRGAPRERQPLEALPIERQPAALDRAALDFCIGGPFFPGIEGGFLFARADTYRAPFRIKETFEAGALTANMALPWQAAFLACDNQRWPAQRPNQVLRPGAPAEADWVP